MKAVSDVIAPLSGEIVEVNEALADAPERINEDPYGEGWLVRVKLSDPSEAEGLLVPTTTASCWRRVRRPRPRFRSLVLVSRYTSATPADRAEMLAAIGVESAAELFEQIPEPLRLGRPLALPAGMGEAEVFERLAALAARNADAEAAGLLPRGWDVRPLRAGDRRRDHRAQRVPHPLHALPAGDLPGRPAGDVRVSDRDVGAHRRCRSPPPASTRARPRSPRPATWRSASPRGGGASSSPAASTRTAARRSPPTRPASAPRSPRWASRTA